MPAVAIVRATGSRASRREPKKAPGEREERCQKAFLTSPMAIGLTTRADGRFFDVNDALLGVVRYTRAEVIGHTAAELDLYVRDEAFQALQQRLLKDGSVRDHEARFRAKTGEVRTVSLSVESIELEGSPCFLMIARDVTQERQDERLRASLYAIVDATESAVDLPDLYRRLHQIIGSLMPADNCYIALHDPAKDELSFPYFVDEREAAPPPYKAGRGLTEYVLRRGTPLLVTPESLGELVAAGEVEEVGAEGVDWLGAPLTVGGRTIGVLAVQSYAETTRYTERERDFLSFISTQVALAIDRKAAQDALREAEARFHTMFRDAPMGILLVDTEGRVQETNPAVEAMLGYDAQELRGMHIRELTFPDDVDESLRLFDSLVRGERPSFLLEKRYLRKDGATIWARLTATHLKSAGPGAPLVLGMIQDVTEERKALEETEATSRRFHAMIEHITDGISFVGADGSVVWQSPSAYHLFGYAAEEIVGRSGFAFVHPEDAAQLGPVFAELMATPGRNMTAEFRIRHKNGSWRWMEAIGTNLLEDPDLHAVIMNYRDITERNEALEQIRFQASLLNQVRNAVIATDKDGRIVYWNAAATVMYGWMFPEVIGKPVSAVIRPSEPSPTSEEIFRHVRDTGHWVGERNLVRKGGATLPADVTITLLRDRREQIVGYVGVSADATERVAVRQELEVRARQEAEIASLGQKALVEPLLSALMNEAVTVLARTLEVEFASLLELLPDEKAFALKARVGWDHPAGTHLANEARGSMAGYAMSVLAPVVLGDAETETRFAMPDPFTRHAVRSGIAAVIHGPARPYGVLSVHTKAKRPFSPDDVHFCEAVANVIADALERNRIEKILGENERMASMGQLAAYVAHEVNTPLTNISLLASSIARREKDPEVQQKIEAIGEQRRKATAIITDLLDFPRQRSSRRSPEDIRKVIHDAVEQVGPFRKPEVDLVVETGDHAVFANIDVIQIRDVLVNLLKNALDATVKGRVVVSLKDWPDFLFISIVDTGTGLTHDVLDQLFHPLSSIKTPGEGTALGLAVSRSIVAAHGGKIEATSEVGKGSTFTVVLPRFEAH